MDLSIDNQVAVVTGGAQGIGESIVRALVGEGCRVAIWDIDNKSAESLTHNLADQGHKTLSVEVDITKRNDVARALSATERQFGDIQILVNNAGFSDDAWILDMSEEKWDRVMNVCLKGTFLCTQAVVPHMLRQKYGRIINIASRASLGGEPDKSNYAAAKGGVVGFTKALAWELGPEGITVNAVAPGFTLTTRLRSLPHYREIEERAKPKQSVKRPGLPADIANGVLYLASSGAGFVNGEIHYITGGRYG